MLKGKNVKSARIKFSALILLFILLIAISGYLHTNEFELSKVDKIKELKSSPAIFIGLYVILSFFPIPFAPANFAAALIYPLLLAITYTAIGNIIFSTIIFWIVRLLGREYIDYLIGRNKKYKHFEDKFEENAFLNIFLLRLFWIIPGEIIGLIAGISKVRFKVYFAATLLGTIPLATFTSLLTKNALHYEPASLLFALLGMTAMIIVPFFVLPSIRKFMARIFGKNKK